MKDMISSRLKRIFLYLALAFFLLVPKWANVELHTEDIDNISSIRLEIVDSGLNTIDKGEMIYNYPDVYVKKISLSDLFRRASQYNFYINTNNCEEIENTEAYIDKVHFSSIQIYLGFWKIWSIDADNIQNFIDKNLFGVSTDETQMLLTCTEGIGKINIINARQELVMKSCFIFGGYFFLFMILYYLFFKNVNRKKIVNRKLVDICIKCFERVKVYLINVILTLILIYIFNFVFGITNLSLHVKSCEIYLQAIAISIVYTFIKNNVEDRKISVMATLIIGLFIIITSAQITELLGADEVRAIDEQLNLQGDIFRHWYMQNAHTNYLIMGTIFYFLPSQFLDNIYISGYEVAKWTHWLCGFLIIQACVSYSFNKIRNNNRQCKINGIILVILYCTFFSCPILVQTLYYYNYDMFSCLFAVLALIICYFGYKNQNLKEITISIIIATLSLQEKIPVIPLMFIICVVWVELYVKSRGEKWKNYLKGSAFTIAIQSVVVIFTNWWVVDVLKAGNMYVQDKRTFTNILYLPLKITGWKSYLLALIFLWVMIIVGSIGLTIIRKIINKLDRAYNFVATLLIIIYYIVGIVISYANLDKINMDTHIGYLLIHIKNCVNQYTTLFLVLSIFILICNLKKCILNNYEITVLFILSIIISILYMIMGEHILARYSNMYISGYIIIFTIIVLQNLGLEVIKTWHIICWSVFTIIEIVPSMNFSYKIFYPIWNTSIYSSGIFEESRVQGCMGAMYFDKVINYCINEGITLSDIHICLSYKARVTQNAWNIPYTYITDKSTNESNYWVTEELLNSNVFYCVDNYSMEDNCIKVNNGYLYLTDVQPVMEIKYRGIVVSRIFRGNQFQLIEVF